MASPAVLRPMIASSSRLTLLHPCHLPKRILRSPLALRYASSVAQQRPVESAAFADVHAPPYISPVDKVKADTLGKGDVKLDKGKAKAVDELGHVEGSDLGTKVQTTEPAPKRRSIRASKSAITMTPAAIQHLKDLLSSPTEPKLLRIGVKTRGCAGMAYHLDYIAPTEIPRFDEVVEQDGVKILIDSKALFSIIGSRMDWRDNRLSAGFVFDNPNVVDTCGCGESFNIQ